MNRSRKLRLAFLWQKLWIAYCLELVSEVRKQFGGTEPPNLWDLTLQVASVRRSASARALMWGGSSHIYVGSKVLRMEEAPRALSCSFAVTLPGHQHQPLDLLSSE